MSIENVQIIVISGTQGGAVPLTPPLAVRFRRDPEETADEAARGHQLTATLAAGRDPVFTVLSYQEWLAGAPADPAVVYGTRSPGWRDAVEPVEPDDERLDGLVFDPAFNDDEARETGALIVNDDELGGGHSMFRAKHIYDAYPLSGGAVAVRVHDDEKPVVRRYGCVDEFLGEHGERPLDADDAERFAAEALNAARGWERVLGVPNNKEQDDDDYDPR